MIRALKIVQNIVETQLAIVWVDKLDKLERKAVSSLRAFFSRQQRDYVRQFKESEKIDFKTADYDLELSQLLHPHVIKAVKLGHERFKLEYDQTDGTGIKGNATISPDWKTIQDVITNISVLRLGELIRGINETTRREIQSIVSDGLYYGSSVQDIAAQIAKKFDKFKSIRTLTIARTELSRAANFAYFKSGESLGMTQKRWLTALDEFVCPVCGSLNGKTVSMSGSFSVSLLDTGGTSKIYSMEYPPAHPNCRCTLLTFVPVDVVPVELVNTNLKRRTFSREAVNDLLDELGLDSNEDPISSAWHKWKHGMQNEVRSDLYSDILTALSPLEKTALRTLLDKFDGDYNGELWRGIIISKFHPSNLKRLLRLQSGDELSIDLRGWTTELGIAKDFATPVMESVEAGIVFHVESPVKGLSYFMDSVFSNDLDHEKELLVKPFTYIVKNVTKIGEGKFRQPIYLIDLIPR